jgi:hypothetical protein
VAKKNIDTSTDSDLPSYIVENDDGSAVVTLVKAATINGEKVTEITMREPTVGDLKRAQKSKGTDAEKDVFLIANLCEIAPADIDALTLRNYSRVSECLALFT